MLNVRTGQTKARRNVTRKQAGPNPVQAADFQIQMSDAETDPVWGAFVAGMPGGTYLQTSLWAQVDAFRGGQGRRFIVRSGGDIVAGAQVLVRRLPFGLNIGHVPRGPLISLDDPELYQVVAQAMHQLARQVRLCFLVVQPPRMHESLVEQLTGWGFRPSPIGAGFTAATLVDLAPDLDAVLAQMRRSRRQNIERGLRAGVTVRQGAAADLLTFYRLHMGTRARQGFLPLPQAYFAHMWRVLAPHGNLKLFLSQHQGEYLSALLAICFGDTVYIEFFGWAGQRKGCQPNEVLIWSVFQWAKAKGYRYCNMGWIDPQDAGAVARGEAVPASVLYTPTFFKMGFSKCVMRFPAGYDYVYHPLLGRVCRFAMQKLANSSSARNAVSRLLQRDR